LFLSLFVVLFVLAACGSTGGTGSTGETSNTSNTNASSGAAANTNTADTGNANANANANTSDMGDTNANANTADTGNTNANANANANAADTNSNANTNSGAAAGGSGALAAIKQRGKLVVGVKYDQPGFGYLNPATNKVEGFDVDMAKLVAKKIFGDENAVEFKEAVSKNRIPYLEQGVVDVVFATMTANADRAKQIDFSDCYYVAGQSLLVPTNSEITGVDALAGKTVGTVKGSTSEKNIREKSPDAKVELFDTYSEAVQAMQSNRVDAVTTDDIILYGFANSNPDRFKVVGGQFTQEPYAAGVKQGNSDLLAQVNAAIEEAKKDGTWAELYKKWVSKDVPPVPPQNWQDVGK
jgi:putative glutamine transport system substrate-binding protein